MATPRVLGQELRLTANLCLARDASAERISKMPQCHLPAKIKRTHQRLVSSSTSSNDTNHSTRAALDDLLRTRWKLDTGLALIRVVTDNRNIVSRCASESTTISRLLLNVRDDSSFWDGAKWEDVANGKTSVLACVDELTGVHALVRDEGLGSQLESVSVVLEISMARGYVRWTVALG